MTITRARPGRRRAIGAALTLGAGGRASVKVALAATDAAGSAIAAHVGNARPEPGPLSLDIASIAENGNGVPVRISVPDDGPSSLHTLSILLLAPLNPDPKIALWHFSALSATAEVATRIRLARSQSVLAIALMSDGTYRRTERAVQVTIGGCGALLPSPGGVGNTGLVRD